MNMKIVYFLIIFSFVATVQSQDKKKKKSVPLPIPLAQSPGSSSPSSASFTSDFYKSPASWQTDFDDGNLTEDLKGMKSSTELDDPVLGFISPLASPRGDQDEESGKQQKSCWAKIFRRLCCCSCKKKTPSQYKEIS